MLLGLMMADHTAGPSPQEAMMAGIMMTGETAVTSIRERSTITQTPLGDRSFWDGSKLRIDLHQGGEIAYRPVKSVSLGRNACAQT
jgi:hypothetical protein